MSASSAIKASITPGVPAIVEPGLPWHSSLMEALPKASRKCTTEMRHTQQVRRSACTPLNVYATLVCQARRVRQENPIQPVMLGRGPSTADYA